MHSEIAGPRQQGHVDSQVEACQGGPRPGSLTCHPESRAAAGQYRFQAERPGASAAEAQAQLQAQRGVHHKQRQDGGAKVGMQAAGVRVILRAERGNRVSQCGGGSVCMAPLV